MNQSALKNGKGLGIISPYLTIKRKRERKMSKTLEKLFDKAMKTGYANINGRMRAYGYVGELESKSDRDALYWLFNHLELPYYAKYHPSVHEFLVYVDFGKGKEEGRLSLS